MRDFIRAALIEALGPPTTRFKSQDDRAWWVVSRKGQADMHICVAGESTAQVAIVLVFDPRDHREPVKTYSARSPAEAIEVIAEISGLTLDRLPAPRETPAGAQESSAVALPRPATGAAPGAPAKAPATAPATAPVRAPATAPAPTPQESRRKHPRGESGGAVEPA
jgi:hypothetical protein